MSDNNNTTCGSCGSTANLSWDDAAGIVACDSCHLNDSCCHNGDCPRCDSYNEDRDAEEDRVYGSNPDDPDHSVAKHLN